MTNIIVGVVAVIMIVGLFLWSGRNDNVTTPVVINNNSNSTSTPIVVTTNNDEVVVTSDKAINLSGQGLTKVPSSVFSQVTVQTLDLSNNNLSGSLPAEVRHLQDLKVLDLSNNKFTGVPAEIGQLKNLEELNLSNNQITGLPNELGQLTNLKVLNLKGNDYSTADLETIKKGLPATVQIIID